MASHRAKSCGYGCRANSVAKMGAGTDGMTHVVDFWLQWVLKPLVFLLSIGYLAVSLWAVHYGPLSVPDAEKPDFTP